MYLQTTKKNIFKLLFENFHPGHGNKEKAKTRKKVTKVMLNWMKIEGLANGLVLPNKLFKIIFKLFPKHQLALFIYSAHNLPTMFCACFGHM